jgi:outer membrane receptor protein involved in Fe transport
MHQITRTDYRFAGNRGFKAQIYAGTAVAALFASLTPSYGQDVTGGIETVVVSSSRITASGFAAPTPTTVVGALDIQQNAQPNVFDTINQLPSLSGSTATNGAASGNGGTSSANNGLSSFNLRGLGTIRTLTLIDGQRVVPAYVTGITDISEFPQLLISRVDVVTGGASASWGSDAVGGVVNFVTDKKFNGIKGNTQVGRSNYGDDTSALFQLAAGTDLFGGRGHIESAAEFYRNDGVQAPNLVGGALAGGRCCNYNLQTLSYTTTTTPVGVPEFSPVTGAQNTSASEYGLITAGALKGISFDAQGNFTPFQFGSPCVGTICVGGDLTNTTQKTTVDDPLTRTVFYTRVSYDLTPKIEVYGTFNFGNVLTFDEPGTGQRTGLVIPCGNNTTGANFYLTASENAACVANKITSFTLGVSYDKFIPSPTSQTGIINIHTLRQQRRYVLGTDGAFNLFGTDWTFDAYAEHGENDASVKIRGIILNARYNAAADAVAGANGTAVCRLNLTTQGAPGCAPFPVFGPGVIAPNVWKYIAPDNGPVSLTSQRQEAAAISVNGTPFKNWAGDVALAFGAEYREEAYATTADPYGDGVTASNPNTAAYPSDPVLDPTGNNWFAGNFHHGSGNYHVYEAFVESGIPLIDSPAWGKADFNIAGRGTEYSTSGFVDTWKLGLTWDTPVNGIRLRALQSRDVRAPNLSELFKAEIVQNNNVIDRTLPSTAPNVNEQNHQVGNPNLKPETAQTTELGVVFQPDYLPGFNLSVDYFRVSIKKEIGSLTNQQEIDLCQIYNNTSYCGLFNLKGVVGTTNPSYVILQPFNLASQVNDGFDIEASYQFDLQDWDIPGRFTLRALATHNSKSILNSGVIGQPIAELAGAATPATGATGAGGGIPLWKTFMSQSWNIDPVTISLTERTFSAGVINPYGITCQAPACPVPTALHPTYSNQVIPGYFFLDIGGNYDFGNGMQAYFKVNNVTDKLPNPMQGLNYDPIGRVYRIGFRFNN